MTALNRGIKAPIAGSKSESMFSTRTCTEAGVEYAKTYAESFAKAGITVISGLAKLSFTIFSIS